jgi:Cu2+-exporting ATPase
MEPRVEIENRKYTHLNQEMEEKMKTKMENHEHGHGEDARHTEHSMKHENHGGHAHHEHHEHMVQDFKKRFWISLILTIPVLLLSPLVQGLLGIEEIIAFPGDSYVLFALSSFIFFYGAFPFLKGLFQEVGKGQPGMMTLISVAISAAYFYSSAVIFGLTGKLFFWELVTLIDIMLLGHWIEMRSIMGASRALEELVKLMPSEAHKLLPDGSIVDIPLSEIKKGDKVLIKPGEKVPTDGEVVDGETSINEAMITGESAPVLKRPGLQVIGGSINGEGSITVEVQKVGKESFLSQMIELVREAQESKSKTQDLANRAAKWLTFISLSVGTVTFIVWYAILGSEFVFALERTITVMVITCPHALGLAIPLVVAVSTAKSAKNGLLIRNRASFERARNIEAIIFDKTGTLTEGRFGVTDILNFEDKISNEDILNYAASVEVHSEHPIAKGVVESAKATFPVKDFKAILGKGAEGNVKGKDVKVVSPGYLRENALTMQDERIDKLSSQGKTVVYLLMDGKVKGAIALADIIRPESKEAVQRLQEMGIRTMMLTGDNRKVAQWVSEEIGLDEYFAEVLPQEKSAKVKEVQSRGITVAMTGDGVNDAPALAQADVGIAIGAGTDVAVETADIILVRSNPLDAAAILKLSKATYRKMIQNLIWATGYNAFAIPLAAGVLAGAGIVLGPALGAVLMSLSTVIVAINARFLKVER